MKSINFIKYLKNCMSDDLDPEEITTVKLGFKQLEKDLSKQEPINVVIVGENEYYIGKIGYCPRCHEVLAEEDNFKYCSNCGQRVNWRKEE